MSCGDSGEESSGPNTPLSSWWPYVLRELQVARCKGMHEGIVSNRLQVNAECGSCGFSVSLVGDVERREDR